MTGYQPAGPAAPPSVDPVPGEGTFQQQARENTQVCHPINNVIFDTEIHDLTRRTPWRA